MSGQKIADHLNDNGFRRRNGSQWTQRQVWAVLKRADLYKKGITRYGEVRGKDENLIIL
jgi:hypothetical protein